ncbi:hypothetical protein D3C75_1119500 [compost metagenome]
MADFLTLDDRVSNAKIRQRIGQRDNHQRDSQQAKLVIVDNPRQHGHLHQAKADNNHRGDSRPFRAADGFFSQAHWVIR